MGMEPASLEYALDYFQNLRALSKELLARETRVALDSNFGIVPLVGLPVSISSTKRRKALTKYFETGVKEGCCEVNDGESCFTGGVQPKSKKRNARSVRKPLVDKNVLDNSCHSNYLTSPRRTDVVKANEALIREQRAEEQSGYSVKGKENISVASSPRNFTSLKGSKESPTTLVDASPIIVDASKIIVDSSPILVDVSRVVGTNAVPAARKASPQREAEAANLIVPRLTRSRAKILDHAGGNTAVAGEGPPARKKPRARKCNSSAISSTPADNQENGKQSAIPEVELEGVKTIVSRSLLEEQTRQVAQSKQLPAARQRSAKADSLTSPETDGNVRKSEGIGAVLLSRNEKDEEAVELDYVASITPNTSVEKDTIEALPSNKKSRTSMEITGRNSRPPPETEETGIGGLQCVEANVCHAADVHSLAKHNIRESPATKTSRETNGNSASALTETDGSDIETIVAHNLNLDCPVADQYALKWTTCKKNDIDHGGVYGSTDLPSEGLAGAEHALVPETTLQSLKDSADNGPKPSPAATDKELLLSNTTPPRHGKERAEPEAEIALPVHPEFKSEEANNISEISGEEHAEEEGSPSLPKSGLSEVLTREFSNLPGETDEGVHSPRQELEKKEKVMDDMEVEYVEMDFSTVKQIRNEIAEIRQTLSSEFSRKSLQVSAICRYVDCDVATTLEHVNGGEFRSRSESALECLDVAYLGISKFLPDHQPDEELTHSDSQVRKDKQVPRSTATPQVHDEEIGAIVPDNPDLDSDERDLCVGKSEVEDIRGRSLRKSTACKVVYDRATSSSPEQQQHEKAGEEEMVASQARNVSFSEGEEDRKEFAGSLEDRGMDGSHSIGVQSSVERQLRDRPSVVGGNTLQVTVLPSFTETNPALINDHKRDWELMRGGNAVKFQDCIVPVSGNLDRPEVRWANNLADRASDIAGCLQSPVKVDKELIWTTASPQSHGELLFKEEGGAFVANGMDLDEEKEFYCLERASEEEIRGVGAVEVEDCIEPDSGCLENSEDCWGNTLADHRSDDEGCIRSPVKGNKELIQTTASPRGHGKLRFEEEGAPIDTSSMDLGDEKELNLLKETPGTEAQHAKPEQLCDPRGGSGVGSKIREKIDRRLRCTPGLFDSVTKRHKPKTPSAWGNVRSQLECEFVKHDTLRGKPASNLEDLDSREDEVMANSSQVSKSCPKLHKFAGVSASQMMADVLMSDDGECNQSFLHEPANEPGHPGFHELYVSVVDRKNAAYGVVPSLKTPPYTNLNYMIGASPQCGPRATSLLCREMEVWAMSKIGSATDWKPQRINYRASILSQEWNTIGPSSIPVQAEYPEEAVSSFGNPQIVNDSYEMVPAESGCKEELSIIRPVSSATAEHVLAVSSLEHSPPKDGEFSLDPSIATPIGCINFLQQSVSSDIGIAQVQSSNLITAMKTFVPMTQRPPPTFLPNGKRDVKVKALDAAQAVKRMQEMKDRQKQMMKRSVENVGRTMEKERANKEAGILQRESVEATNSDRLPSMGKSVLIECSNSKRLFSSVTKFKGATATKLRIEKKLKKHEEEIRRKEEEIKKKDAKILAWRQNKEQMAKNERERKRQKQEALLRQRKGEETQLREDLDVKGAKQAEIQTDCQQREVLEEKQQNVGAGLVLAARSTMPGPGQQSRDSNLLGSSLPIRSAARVPSGSTDKRTHAIVGQAVPSKGQLSSSPRLLSSNAGFTPGGPHKSTSQSGSQQHHGVPTDVKNGESDSGVSCLETPTGPEVVEREDMGPMSYEISPYRESSDDEDEKQPPKIAKHIPIWARKDNLKPQLLKQLTLDPDEIFAGSKTCSLKEVFGTNGSQKVLDFGKRSGSGDWVKDRVSWKEELQYKISMGYMQKKYP